MLISENFIQKYEEFHFFIFYLIWVNIKQKHTDKMNWWAAVQVNMLLQEMFTFLTDTNRNNWWEEYNQ